MEDKPCNKTFEGDIRISTTMLKSSDSNARSETRLGSKFLRCKDIMGRNTFVENDHEEKTMEESLVLIQILLLEYVSLFSFLK